MQRQSDSKGREMITVRGVVAPTEWDMRDEVTAVTIFALDESEYVVTAKGMVRRLMKYADEEIEARGYLSQDEYGNEVFVVVEFAPVDAEDDAEGGGEKDEDWDDDELLDDDEDEWPDEVDLDEEDEDQDWDEDDAGMTWKHRRP